MLSLVACGIVACHVLFTKSVKLPNTIQEVGEGSLTSLWAGNSPAEILIQVKLFQGKRIDQILLLYFKIKNRFANFWKIKKLNKFLFLAIVL